MLVDYIFSLESRKTRAVISSQKNNGEKIKRSLMKTISWRLVGTFDTILISYFITGAFGMAFSIGAIELLTKLVLYFFHERAWDKIKWGKQCQ